MRITTSMAVIKATVTLLLAAFYGAPAEAQASSADAEFFESKIRPLLSAQCYSCHSSSSSPVQGSLRLDSREALLRGGKRGPAFLSNSPQNSPLIKAVSYTDPTLQMPPGNRLTSEQIANLREWLKRGAPWPAGAAAAPPARAFNIKERLKHWAWQPVRNYDPPIAKQSSWIRNPIDSFVLAKLKANALRPAPAADPRTLLRRLCYDLTGLPPTVQELHAFLADRSPNAYANLVDRLLASPHYGERWARHWLDLVRYAETDGHEWDQEKQGAYQYRDYLIRAFNADVPYKQFVMEHIAGDLLPSPRLNPALRFNESAIATGFLWLGSSKHSPVDFREDQAERIDNQIDVIGKAFLGVTLGCARCHDHKFDAISTRDYYALFGVLKSTRMATCPVTAPLPEASRRQLSTLAANAQQASRRDAAEALQRLFAPGSGFPAMDWSAERREPTSVLYPAAMLLSASVPPSSSEFKRAKEAVLTNLQAAAAKAAEQSKRVHWLPTFTPAWRGDRWRVSGDAFDIGATTGPIRRLGGEPKTQAPTIFPAGTAYSGALSETLPGVLRSPTFTIDRSNLHYHVSGHNSQVRLVIEGYVRKKIEIIYGRLAMDVDSPSGLSWLTQNVADYTGHRAYVELVTDGSGYIACDKVCLSDGDPPAEAPDPQVIRMLQSAETRSAADILNWYSGLSARTLSSVKTASSLVRPESSAGLALLAWAMQRLPSGRSASRWLADVTQQRAIAAEPHSQEVALASADGTGEDSAVYRRGSYKTPGPVVKRRFLEAFDRLPPIETTETSGRLQLAERMTAPSDTLLARVIVNRVWQHHFGEGIVRTPDDFGVKGDPPTHPELLDWLAFHFTAAKGPYACNWSLKKLHRLIVLSSAYKMSSVSDAKSDQTDPQNRLLHRMPVRRLEAECIRDGILTVSGRLDRTVCGAPVMPYINAFTPGRGAPPSGPLDGGGRRSIYLSIRRNFPIPLFAAFDYPTPITTIGKRSVSNVPAQALALLNNPFVYQQAGVWAKSALAAPGDTDTRIERLYEAAFTRLPTAAERQAARDFLADARHEYGTDEQRKWTDLCHVLFNVKEFIFVR
jgi:hypothetical protein